MNSYEVMRFETLGSTNDYVKAHLGSLKDHTLILAGFQTRGRGRRERRWDSAADKNFLGTFYRMEPSATNTQSMMTGVVAVVRTLGTLGVEACIKPPNDVYAKDRKIAGILAEVIHLDTQHVIIGVGVNVNEQKAAPATSLHDLTQRHHDLDVFTDLIRSSMETVEAETEEAIFQNYIRHIPFGRISAHSEDVRGYLDDLDPTFNCTVGGKKVPCESLTFDYK